MTNDERTEGARAIAAVMIGNGVAWDTLSERVQERCARAYEAAAWVRARHQMAACVVPMNLMPDDVGTMGRAVRRAAEALSGGASDEGAVSDDA